MNPSSKLLIAAALVAAGYGLATLLGAPDPALAPNSPGGVDWSLPGGVDRQAAWTGGASVVGSVRLLPDPALGGPVGAGPLSAPATDTDLATGTRPEPPPASVQADSTPTRGASPWRPPAPQATLDGAESTPVAMAPASTWEDTRVETVAAPVASASMKPIAATPSPTRQASFDWSSDAAPTPPPLAPVESPVEASAVQIHVVVDGDSLPRLAGRYLDDPHRGDEIYRLNRDVLPSPDLLPIGVELKIPARGQPGQVEKALSDARTSQLDTGPRHGLVPVGVAPALPASAPRAQLLRPVPAG